MGQDTSMKMFRKLLYLQLLVMVCSSLSGCNDPHIYGNIGISSGYSKHGHGGWNPGIHTSISVGGRIL